MDTILSHIEELVHSGKAKEAQTALYHLKKKGISPKDLLEAATLARRAALPELALTILFPVVRPASKVKRQATDKDRVEFAASLISLGAIEEARELLNSVNTKETPQALFHSARIALLQWDYPTAIPNLRAFINTGTLSVYERLEAKLHLLPALLAENNLISFKLLLAQVTEESSQRGFASFYAIALRLLGDYELKRSDSELADSYFESAEMALRNWANPELIATKKCRAILRFAKNPHSKTEKEKLFSVREEALCLNQMEAVRDIDFQIARITNDQSLFLKLYFGTPFPSFKAKVLPYLESGVPRTYAYAVPMADAKRTRLHERQIDLSPCLKPGKALHRLYQILLSDFYRPFSPATLFARLYPSELFLGTGSNNRVHRAVLRLKTWFHTHGIPLQIQMQSGTYRLVATAPCKIQLHDEREVLIGYDIRSHMIRKSLPNEFTLKQAGNLLGISVSSATSVLRSVLETGVLLKKGKARNTVYAWNR